jgi:hypothetical protein
MLRLDDFDVWGARRAAGQLDAASAEVARQSAVRRSVVAETSVDWMGGARREFDRRVEAVAGLAARTEAGLSAAAQSLRAEAQAHERAETNRIAALRRFRIEQAVVAMDVPAG